MKIIEDNKRKERIASADITMKTRLKMMIKLKLKMKYLEGRDQGLRRNQKHAHQSDRRRKSPLYRLLKKIGTFLRSGREQQNGQRRWVMARSKLMESNHTLRYCSSCGCC